MGSTGDGRQNIGTGIMCYNQTYTPLGSSVVRAFAHDTMGCWIDPS